MDHEPRLHWDLGDPTASVARGSGICQPPPIVATYAAIFAALRTRGITSPLISSIERSTFGFSRLDTITYAACHWQNDPHVMGNCSSWLDEYRHNRTARRDDIIRGYVKHQSRYIKRAPTHNCFRVLASNSA